MCYCDLGAVGSSVDVIQGLNQLTLIKGRWSWWARINQLEDIYRKASAFPEEETPKGCWVHNCSPFSMPMCGQASTQAHALPAYLWFSIPAWLRYRPWTCLASHTTARLIRCTKSVSLPPPPILPFSFSVDRDTDRHIHTHLSQQFCFSRWTLNDTSTFSDYKTHNTRGGVLFILTFPMHTVSAQ